MAGHECVECPERDCVASRRGESKDAPTTSLAMADLQLSGQWWIFHPANLLIHGQKIETVPRFDDLPVTNPANRDAGKLNWMVRRRAAKVLAGMPALHDDEAGT